MLGRDPVKRGLNGYPYCSNNPVNYVDPTGEIFDILMSAGAAGSALEQLIGTGDVSVRKSLTDGVTNALTQQIYGNDPIKNLGSVIARGMGAGAASSGICYLSNTLGRDRLGQAARNAQQNISPYVQGHDPRSGCGTSGIGTVGYSTAHGYRYSELWVDNENSKEFDLKNFC